MKIFFREQPTPDTCMSACVSMLLDKDVHDVISDIHEAYMATTSAEQEYELLHGYLEANGLPSSISSPDELTDGLYLSAILREVDDNPEYHACLVSIRQGNMQIVNPNMFRDEIFTGLVDEGCQEPDGFYVILKVEWDDFVKKSKEQEDVRKTEKDV